MDIAGPIRAYIEERFSPQEAKDAEEDLETLSLLRSEVVSASGSQTPEQRRETLLAYFRALSVVESRFPVSKQGGHVNLPFAWTDAFNSRKRAVVTATLMASPGSAHNWMHGLRSRANYDAGKASTTKPCRARTQFSYPNVNVNAGQPFMAEWMTGHGASTYFLILRAGEARGLPKAARGSGAAFARFGPARFPLPTSHCACVRARVRVLRG